MGKQVRPFRATVIIADLVLLHGLLLLFGTLFGEVRAHNPLHLTSIVINIRALGGVSLLYLSTVLRRRKQVAWPFAVGLYALLLGLNSELALDTARRFDQFRLLFGIQNIVFPLIVLGLLLVYRRRYTARSDPRNLASAVRVSLALLAVAFLYGVAGFMLLDRADFHHEISAVAAMHHTVDQLDLTTAYSIQPYTRRARLFLDSLNMVSFGAVVYVVLALFQPLRYRIENHEDDHSRARTILERYGGSSEDYFKLWPQDKSYMFSPDGNAFLAYQVRRGVALLVGDPAGDKKSFPTLLRSFMSMCAGNDWQPAGIHVESTHKRLYRDNGFALQMIGEEAVVSVEKFMAETVCKKYFRHIKNKFEKQGYHVEVFNAPHDAALLLRLRELSDEWLRQPGRVERGFMLGYHDDAYFQQCDIFALKDSAGTIRAFMNQVPSYDEHEANFDLLRASANALPNANDFLLIGFIHNLSAKGVRSVNLGLCPLSGLKSDTSDSKIIDTALRVLYANGDRLYSFSGLHRFKSKYEPEWSPRFIAYKGGIPAFTRVLQALNTAMKLPKN